VTTQDKRIQYRWKPSKKRTQGPRATCGAQHASQLQMVVGHVRMAQKPGQGRNFLLGTACTVGCRLRRSERHRDLRHPKWVGVGGGGTYLLLREGCPHGGVEQLPQSLLVHQTLHQVAHVYLHGTASLSASKDDDKWATQAPGAERCTSGGFCLRRSSSDHPPDLASSCLHGSVQNWTVL